ncbi:hypothetical protein [Arcticibacter sp.]|jgi:hypothetical protein|uniref:hypothetical protein n=1 Tax=Arcticibacter sp. TaxID=1872630 RepID=UPI0038900033
MKVLYLAIALFLFHPSLSSGQVITDSIELLVPDVSSPDDPQAKIKAIRAMIASLNRDTQLVEEGDLRIELSKIMFKEGWTKKAFSELLTAEMLFHKAGDSEKREAAIATMAAFYKANNALADAEKYYTLLLQVQETQQKYAEAAKTANILAGVLMKRQDVKKASGYLNTIIENQYDAPNGKSTLADAYVKLAEIRRVQKKYKQAESLILKKALGLYRSAGNQVGRVNCFDVLGHIYLEQKRHSEAKWFFIQANTLARNLNDEKGVVVSLVNLSRVKVAIKDYSLAARDLKEASAIAARLNNLSLMADVKDGYANYYSRTGNKIAAKSSERGSVKLTDSVSRMMTSQAESAHTAQVVPHEPVAPVVASEEAPRKQKNYTLEIAAAIFSLILLGAFLLKRKKE